jgi:hypothetical protein
MIKDVYALKRLAMCTVIALPWAHKVKDNVVIVDHE